MRDGLLREPKPRPICIEGTIYFVRRGDYVKIGFSSQLRLRLTALQTSSPEPLVLLGTMRGTRATERRLQDRFCSLRARGEWFHARPRLLRYIASAAPDQQAFAVFASAREPIDGPECWNTSETLCQNHPSQNVRILGARAGAKFDATPTR